MSSVSVFLHKCKLVTGRDHLRIYLHILPTFRILTQTWGGANTYESTKSHPVGRTVSY